MQHAKSVNSNMRFTSIYGIPFLHLVQHSYIFVSFTVGCHGIWHVLDSVEALPRSDKPHSQR